MQTGSEWEKLWRFVRGDDSASVFEAWFYREYQHPDVVRLVGEELITAAIETDYRAVKSVDLLREALRKRLSEGLRCRCVTWRSDDRFLIGPVEGSDRTESVDEFLAGFEVLNRRTPWLQSLRCPQCGSYWYLAIDTHDDFYHVHRLSPSEAEQTIVGKWPDVYDRLAVAWPTKEWLELYGYKDLEDWQARNANVGHPPPNRGDHDG